MGSKPTTDEVTIDPDAIPAAAIDLLIERLAEALADLDHKRLSYE
jgi:hypothetical protein